ncbi:chemotaxis protein CheC [Thermoanaerobacterium thermosaccharolyticum]|jgi:chemotaxis protein CheC|uniref:CheC, inhibitor of MCP methylation n=2 Tax=Thermoanaerobacterium thermosaccharolyticum TaxID=1517 RepID=D9TMA3_THETC|nr:chemotaxis protein CheC [Thermoanaerobacterium thermosaccharolyticum]TCW38667.1 chemotaxis protein CheC [Thermohydrogenium kirishiense]ADL68944.1 CheC, inhibitor of MCP methylation [Thermoanaerobacterium thermosaccharolyticum DSM 571]AST59014.1 chemotaxis protein CheC, inhibitor of MCP methylation [Thermoanaerobacterium thermosaccharolyticum]KAA5807751.1 chemotaxis protein CheC [Thermoanaerobacterium thermosaccharolyticum]MBE0068041.1 chemotaxis protein CheC [Thermoanaerobacterium thermosac
MNIDKLNETCIDILKELGNIGSGNAITALASIIGKKIDMKIPSVKLMDFNEVQNIFGLADAIIVGIYFDLEGSVKGNILFSLDIESASYLIEYLMGVNVGEEFSDIEKSALQEIGNIMAGSYVSSLSTLTNLDMKISPPAISIDMAGAILSVPAIKFSELSDKILFIETEFFEGSKLIKGDFFLIPDIESFDKILNALGVELDG